MTFDPGQTMSDLERVEAEHEEWADKLADRIEAEGPLRDEYDREMAFGRLYADDILASNGKPPSQDRRQDYALRYLYENKPELYHDYRQAKTAREVAETRERAKRASLSVKQTKARILGGS